MITKEKLFVFFAIVAVTSAGHAQQDEAGEGVAPLDPAVPVADQASLATSDSDDDSELTDELILAEFERYRRLVDENAMDEADTSAKRIVQMTLKLYGPESLEAARALNNLAIVQSRIGQYDAAIQNFESAIGIIETVEDRLNDKLVNPLKGLGAAQLNSGRPDLAVRSYDRARHITHVNEGPHNVEQVEILESLAEATLRAGDLDGARDILDSIFLLNARHFENDALAMVPSLMRRGEWQHRAGYFNDERATYRRVVRIIETRLGKEDPKLIVPLKKLGESFYFVDLTAANPYKTGVTASGEVYFKRAVRIAEKSPDVHWTQKVAADLALADYYTYAESYNRARRIYTATWDFLSAAPERLEARSSLLEQPTVLFQKALPTHVFDRVSNRDAVLTGTIVVDYNVSARGRVRSIRTEADPPEFTDLQRMVHREIRSRIFRPRLIDGVPQNSENIRLEHSFYYRQSDLDALKSPADENTDD
ncbi:MAG: tetratricopeptide repeat protein [Gammaproteobacteria bacterium]|nr:tetratricopeptide repeat protein [Gammaproteobacteria bacterium]